MTRIRPDGTRHFTGSTRSAAHTRSPWLSRSVRCRSASRPTARTGPITRATRSFRRPAIPATRPCGIRSERSTWPTDGSVPVDARSLGPRVVTSSTGALRSWSLRLMPPTPSLAAVVHSFTEWVRRSTKGHTSDCRGCSGRIRATGWTFNWPAAETEFTGSEPEIGRH